MKKVIAVFDIGKTNKKLLLFDENLQVAFQQEQKFPVTKDDDGFECDDIDLITSWMRKELEKLIDSKDFDPVAVNFSTYGASLMFVGKDGKRLTPVYNYMKEVSPSIVENLFNQYGGENEFLRKAASPALGLLLNSGIQILWLKKEKPEIYKKVGTILHFPQYLSYYLTGKLVSEPTSIGCHTFMWDYDNMCYNKWLSDNDIKLPDPINDDVVFDSKIGSKILKVGVGIHDSSASLVPYLLGSEEPFILVSTGTWCINMNPYNKEPLTADQLSQDCLCFMSPKREQVKSSRLFMGHFHDVWVDKLAEQFGVKQDNFKTVKYDGALIQEMKKKFFGSVFFPNGKESFDEGLKSADLSLFKSYEEAYTQLIIELTGLSIHAVNLVIPENDSTKNIYISGGFARNDIYVRLMAEYFSNQKIYTSEIDNSSALGAALVISQTFTGKKEINPNLGLKSWH